MLETIAVLGITLEDLRYMFAVFRIDSFVGDHDEPLALLHEHHAAKFGASLRRFGIGLIGEVEVLACAGWRIGAERRDVRV